jgi:hypothetical protein
MLRQAQVPPTVQSWIGEKEALKPDSRARSHPRSQKKTSPPNQRGEERRETRTSRPGRRMGKARLAKEWYQYRL